MTCKLCFVYISFTHLNRNLPGLYVTCDILYIRILFICREGIILSYTFCEIVCESLKMTHTFENVGRRTTVTHMCALFG